MAAVVDHSEDRIVISTQVVEAGIDLNAAALITEAAPWPSLVQRAGRCNRTGLLNSDAELLWIPPAKALPYEQGDVDATCAQLAALEGRAVTGEDLLAFDVDVSQKQVKVVRKSDFLDLFDITPDLSGNDVDIALYVRDAEDLDAEVAWAAWTPGEQGAPDPEIKAPPAEYRCRVALGDVAKLARDRAVWRFDQVAGKWTRVTAQPRSRARPSEVLLVSAVDGGYDLQTGFDLSARGPVPGSPALATSAELAEVVAGTEDAYAADTASVAPRRWQYPAAARPARDHAHRGPGPVRVRRRPLLDPDRPRPAGPVRPVHPRLPGDPRPRRRLARERRERGNTYGLVLGPRTLRAKQIDNGVERCHAALQQNSLSQRVERYVARIPRRVQDQIRRRHAGGSSVSQLAREYRLTRSQIRRCLGRPCRGWPTTKRGLTGP